MEIAESKFNCRNISNIEIAESKFKSKCNENSDWIEIAESKPA